MAFDYWKYHAYPEGEVWAYYNDRYYSEGRMFSMDSEKGFLHGSKDFVRRSTGT